jgi:hypothetical protein
VTQEVFLTMMMTMMITLTMVWPGQVRVPVKYQSTFNAQGSVMKAVLTSALDRLTLWYFVYLLLALLSVSTSRLFSPFLLLDIIMKNSTTRLGAEALTPSGCWVEDGNPVPTLIAKRVPVALR